MKRTAALIAAALFLFTNKAVSADTDYVTAAAKRIYETTQNPVVSSVGGEWAVIGLSRSGYDVPKEYYDNYYENAKKYVTDSGGVLHDKKYTEYSRVILALSAIGKNPADVEGYNLLMPLADYNKTIYQGINGPVWALIALDSKNYEIPKNTAAEVQATREMYIDKILSCQGEDGGWSLSGESSDPDITAMSCTALARYRSREDVLSSINSALAYLSAVQNENGGYSSGEIENSESCAQVIVALCTLGVSPDDTRFVKNGKSALDSLVSFYDGSGGFYHTYDKNGSSQMAAEQALYALAAVKRLRENKTPLFDMSDVKADDTQPKDGEEIRFPVLYPGKTFKDTAECPESDKINALAQRGIVNGTGYDMFNPDNTMTRAEFTAICVNVLGLEPAKSKIFDDVSEDDWYFDCVSAAYKGGIVNGISDRLFNPDGTVAKEEAAVMIMRAAKMCGIERLYDNSAIRDILAGFTDYMKISGWAKEAVAFCCDNGILPDDDVEICPQKNVTRAEMASMFYNMLCAAELL